MWWLLWGMPFTVLAAGELHKQGTDATNNQHRLPDNAIDTTQVPEIALHPTDGIHDVLPVYDLTGNSYFLFGNIAQIDSKNRGFNGNAGFVVTSEGVVVIDALGTPLLGRRLIATIRSITNQPIKYLIITHNHPDHAYGSIAFRELPDVRIIMHQGVNQYLNSEEFVRSVDYRKDLLGRDMQRFSMPEPDELIGGARFSHKTITIGGKTFIIYNVGQHHSYGDLIVHQVEDGIVWISDLAFNQRVTYMGDGHSKQALEAQSWLLENFADVRLMAPGHGSAQTSPFPMVTKTKTYISELRSKMAEMVENGVSLLDAVNKADIPAWKNICLYDVNHRANANFVYREMEREYFQ
ncbi:MAG: MBL fold metallo-hydrolase [Gammaproteobacteria bacterium]|jgi:glyoxylase-like metal-dependent hydrolase (beta-lactamase superfamily II)